MRKTSHIETEICHLIITACKLDSLLSAEMMRRLRFRESAVLLHINKSVTQILLSYLPMKIQSVLFCPYVNDFSLSLRDWKVQSLRMKWCQVAIYGAWCSTGYAIVKWASLLQSSADTLKFKLSAPKEMSRLLGIVFLGFVAIVATENSTSGYEHSVFGNLQAVRTCVGRLELKFENVDDIMR